MSPSAVFCQNMCEHCWRAIEHTQGKVMKGKIDFPEEIIEKCINAQRKLLSGFKGNKKVNIRKWKEAQNPNQFAISLIGEPTLYPKLPKFIRELRKREITSFLVTNGLCPEMLLKLKRKKALPTQLYVSLNYPDEKLFRKITKNKQKNSWKKFNSTLELLPKLPTRKVIRMTLVRKLNMKDEMINSYTKLIKKSLPHWIEIKGYISVGFARKRLGYERMPTFEEVMEYAEKIARATKYKIEDCDKLSKVILVKGDHLINRFISSADI
jgi:tRNA wybutosine-synthesizing protein 1